MTQFGAISGYFGSGPGPSSYKLHYYMERGIPSARFPRVLMTIDSQIVVLVNKWESVCAIITIFQSN